MTDDIVGQPIFFMDDTNKAEEFLNSFAGLNINPAVALLIMARFEALAQAVDDGEADGIIVGSCDGKVLCLMIVDAVGERILERPVPDVPEDEVVSWIISSIQGVGSKLNLITDPCLCQCFCGFAGHPNDWLEVLAADII